MSQQLAYIKRNYLCYWRKLRKDFPIINNKILKVPFILIMTSSVSSLIFFISYILLEWFNIQFEHILLIFILLVLYIVFKDMKNNIIFLRYSAINGELFFTIPSPWRRIYSSTLIERAIVPYIFIWLTTLVITISTIILAEHSFHLLLNWAFFLSITLLLLFIFKDIISLILLYLSTVLLNKDLNGGLPFLNKAIFYFFASLVTSLMISNIAIYNEPLSFLENIVSIIFSYNTAFKWLSNEIENAINGRINIHNYIRLYILTILMLSIRSIIFLLLDKTNFFPLNKSKQENIIHPIALLLLKLVKPLNHFLFYTLLRKDIIYLSRHTLFQEKFRIFFYTLIIMSGSMTGLLLFIMENPIRLYLTFKCFLFSPPVTTFLILFLVSPCHLSFLVFQNRLLVLMQKEKIYIGLIVHLYQLSNLLKPK